MTLVIYEEYRPPASADTVIAALWRFELEPGDTVDVHAIPPDGCVAVAVAWSARGIERLGVVGPRVTALRVPVRAGVTYVGARFRPGTSSVIGLRARTLYERVEPLATVAPDRANALHAALRDAVDTAVVVGRLGEELAGWVAAAPAPDPAVTAMVARTLDTHGGASSSEVCGAAGLSYRQGLRRFTREVGLSPKALARLARVRFACLQAVAAEGRTWADISAESGFADQAHLAREFSDVFGWPPRLVRAYLERIDHVGPAFATQPPR